jgi:hypothetical protein
MGRISSSSCIWICSPFSFHEFVLKFWSLTGVRSWKTIHEIVNVHTKIAIRLSKIFSPIVYCYAGVFQRFCSVTFTHLWICLILISRTNSQMNWYIIININLFLTKLMTNLILKFMKTKEYCNPQRIWNLLAHTTYLLHTF